jgi:Predicted glutamine amidotransferase
MCVIAICRERNLTRLEVEQMDAANPHGIGVAWASRKRDVVQYAKGLSVDETLALLPTLPKPYIVHFRFASVGSITPALCHPFPIHAAPSDAVRGATKAGVLFHNGTWGEWKTGFEAVKELGSIAHDTTHEGWSDSRVMAALAAAYATHAVAEIVGATQRLAVLRPSGTIETYGAWTKHHGIEVSNLWWTFQTKAPTILRHVTAFDDLPIDAGADVPEPEDVRLIRTHKAKAKKAKPGKPAKKKGKRGAAGAQMRLPVGPARVPRPTTPSRSWRWR